MAVLDLNEKNYPYDHAGLTVNVALNATAGVAQGIKGPEWASQALITFTSDNPSPGTAPTATSGWYLPGITQDGSNIGTDALPVASGGSLAADRQDAVGRLEFCVAADANSARARILFTRALSG